MGAWWSAEEAESRVAPTPSPSKISAPASACGEAATAMQLDGARFALDARALPPSRPCRADAQPEVGGDMGGVWFP